MQDDLQDEFVAQALEAGTIAWDIETTGLDWRGDRIGTCQLLVPGVGSAIVQLGDRLPTRMADLLAQEAVMKVFHHAPFDLRFMAYQWEVRPANVACTKVAAKIIWPDLDGDEYSLKPLVHRLLDVDLDKSQQRSDWKRTVLTAEQVQYAAADVQHLLPLMEELRRYAVKESVLELINASFSYLPMRVALDISGAGDVFAY
jgi:ribonuclease D